MTAQYIWIFTAFIVVPHKALILRCCFIHLKALCKALHNAFGELKGIFRTRPVFHWTDDRIIGHIMVCFLAYLCEAHLTKNLRSKAELLNSKAIKKDCIKTRPLTTVQGLKELNQVLAIPIKVKKQILWVRTDIPQNAMKLLNAISIKIPPKILKKEEM